MANFSSISRSTSEKSDWVATVKMAIKLANVFIFRWVEIDLGHVNLNGVEENRILASKLAGILLN